jgi:hypothetical protein
MKFWEFITSRDLVGEEFLGDSWATWRIIARLFDGDAALLNDDERAIALRLTGRTTLPTRPPDTLVVGAGRRSGKSRFCGLAIAYMAAQDYQDRLAPGEEATVVVCGPDRDQAAGPFGYASGIINRSLTLSAWLSHETADTMEFEHRSRVEIVTSSYRTIRGRTLAGACVDEAAFLPSEGSALPDEKLFQAIRPGLLTLRGRVLVISSPYMRQGLLHDLHVRYFGNDRDDSGLFISATSLDLNPTLDAAVIAAEAAADPESAASEYFGKFRTSSTSYLDEDLLSRAVIRDRRMLVHGYGFTYHAFVDASSGRNDAFTVAIAHSEPGGRVVLDAMESVQPPFEPPEAVEKCAKLIGQFGLGYCTGDRYATGFVAHAFARHGVRYSESPRNKSEIYRQALPLFTSHRVELLDNHQLLTELRLLERRPQPGGGEKIDHPNRVYCHDDLANAVVGALLLAADGPIAGDYGQVNATTRCITEYDVLDPDRGSRRETGDDPRPMYARPILYI